MFSNLMEQKIGCGAIMFSDTRPIPAPPILLPPTSLPIIAATRFEPVAFVPHGRKWLPTTGGHRHNDARAGAALSKGQIELQSCISMQVKVERHGGESRTLRDMHARLPAVYGGCKL
jgi:hypothetical protein